MRSRNYLTEPNEPALNELLDDPMLETLLRRDRLSRADLIAAICAARARLGLPDCGCVR